MGQRRLPGEYCKLDAQLLIFDYVVNDSFGGGIGGWSVGWLEKKYCATLVASFDIVFYFFNKLCII